MGTTCHETDCDFCVCLRRKQSFMGFFVVFLRFLLCAWLSLKAFCSRVLASFAGHRCLPHSPMSFRWTKETAMASFQLRKCVWWLAYPNAHCQVSYGTTSASLSNTTIYKNYFRANPPSTTLAPTLLALMNQFSWKRVGLLTQDETRFIRV
jgi:hypothetical protein